MLEYNIMSQLPEMDGFIFKEPLLQTTRCLLWRAEQKTLERDVYLAILQPEVMENVSLCNLLFDIFRTLARSRTSLLPEIIDMVRTSEMAYVVLEACEAKNILQLLTDCRLDAQQVFQIAEGLAKGFAELDRAHLVYGGLRPKHLYLTEESLPILLDPTTIAYASGYGEQPDSDTLIGSAPYVAPEQYLAPECVDTRADMFAMGMTLYALATGQIPYGAMPPEEILEMKQTQAIPSPCDISPNFPPALALLLSRLAQREPADRYNDWDDVLFDLHQARQGIAPDPGNAETTVIALPDPTVRAQAGRTVRLTLSDLRSYRHRKLPANHSRLLLGIIAVLTVLVVVLLAIVIGMLIV